MIHPFGFCWLYLAFPSGSDINSFTGLCVRLSVSVVMYSTDDTARYIIVCISFVYQGMIACIRLRRPPELGIQKLIISQTGFREFPIAPFNVNEANLLKLIAVERSVQRIVAVCGNQNVGQSFRIFRIDHNRRMLKLISVK